MRKTVVIDRFPESVQAYRDGYAIVAVDVGWRGEETPLGRYCSGWAASPLPPAPRIGAL